MKHLQIDTHLAVQASHFGHVYDLEFPTRFIYGHGSAPALTYPEEGRAEIVTWADGHYNRPKLI